MIWEQFHPCPPGPVKNFRKDPRYLEMKGILGKLFKLLIWTISIKSNFVVRLK